MLFVSRSELFGWKLAGIQKNRKENAATNCSITMVKTKDQVMHALFNAA